MKTNMNRTKLFTIITMALAGLLISIFTSCYLPSPLYGTWADGNGRDKIKFMDDGTFSATILNSDETTTEYSGEWSTVDNILVLLIKGETNYSRNVPWSINGAILYLDWTDASGNQKVLTLYHIER